MEDAMKRIKTRAGSRTSLMKLLLRAEVRCAKAIADGKGKRSESSGGRTAGKLLVLLLCHPGFFLIEHLEEEAGRNGPAKEPSLRMDVLFACGKVVCLDPGFDA